MRGWKLRWVVAGLAALLIAAGAIVAWPRPDRITRANFDRINEGMGRAEVEAVLGPPGDYRTRPAEYSSLARLAGGRCGSSFRSDDLEVSHEWQGDTAIILVSYNRDGAIVQLGIDDAGDPQPGVLDTLLWRGKRQWQKWFPE